MAKICQVDGCRYPVFGKGYCKGHQHLRGDFKRAERKPIKIRQHSVKRARINRIEYAPKARQFVIDHPECNIRSPECTGKSQCVNHRKGKDSIELLLDDNFWEASCFRCNTYIEEHHNWGKERGHKLSRFS